MPSPDISVIVPTFNRPHALQRLLHSLARQQLPHDQFEVIIVDDGGDSPLQPLLRPFRHLLNLCLLCVPKQGCGPARQAGVDLARGQFLAFTDDDCRPQPDWLLRLLAALHAHPSAAVGGLTINALTSSVFSEATQWLVNSAARGSHPSSPAFCPTSNVAFPRDPFLAIGGLNRHWHNSGGEDRDLCLRWRLAGFPLLYEPSACVLHYHALNFTQFLRLHFRYGRGAFTVHFHRHASFPSPQFYLRLIAAPPFRYGCRKGFPIAAAVLLAQTATLAGSIAEALRPEVRS